MKIFRDDLPASTLRAHVILAAATPANDGVSYTAITEADGAALEFLQSLGAVEHVAGTEFELTAVGECYRSLVLLED